jgi:hypothetical protein
LAYGAERIGIVLPNAAQIDEFHGIPGIATKAVVLRPIRSRARLRYGKPVRPWLTPILS